MADNNRFEKLGSLLGEKLDKATKTVSNAVENFDANQMKESITEFGDKVVKQATEKYDEAVGEDKYCALCGKKLGIIGKRKIADGTLCNECSTKYQSAVEERGLVFNQLNSSDLAIIKQEYDAKQKKSSTYIFIGAAIVLALCFGFLNLQTAKYNKEHENQVKVKDIDYSLYSDNKDSIEKKFTEAGFSNFEYVELDDLSQSEKADVGKVEKIEIDGDSNVKKIEWAEKNAKVTIYYHVLAPEKETISNNSSSSSNSKNSGNSSTQSSTTSNTDLETFKSLCDMTMADQFDYYYSYINDGVLFINITNEGTAQGAVLAKNGNEELKKAWDEMKQNLITANLELVKTAEDMGIDNPMISYNVLNDANKDNVLLSMLNGVVVSDAVND